MPRVTPYLLAAVAGLCALAGLAREATAQEAPVSTIAAVAQLSPERARQHPAARIRGVVTFTWHSEITDFTVEDPTGVIWISPILLPTDCRVGTEVEIAGEADSGVFGPYLRARTVRRIGEAALPAPLRASFEELLAAPLHGRRVEFTGVVRMQRVNPESGLNWLALEVSVGGGRLTVNVTHEIVGHPELVDALVRIRGVNLHTTDAQQQAFLPMINAHSLADIDVLVPANPKPYEQPITSLSNLMRTASMAVAGHGVHVSGVVTYVGAGGSFYLQDNSRGTQVFLREALLPVPGEAVDVIGFPEPGAFSPILRDSDWRPVDAKPAVAPQPVTLAEATEHDGRLITIQAKLVDQAPGNNEVVLTLEDGAQRARVHVANGLEQTWRLGSILRATGVCRVEIGGWESLVAHHKPQGFALLVQAASAVRLVQAAPWWTVTRIAWALAAAAGLLCCIFGLIWLQTRARLQEAARTREAAHRQFVTVIGERNRIAREIHDSLAQGFAGISAQLEVINDRLRDAPAALRQHLDLARELVRDSLDEARRSVWNLRAQALEKAGLVEALSRIGRQLTDGGQCSFEVEVEGTPRPLAVDIENNLLRAGQEAITNAVRHSGAKRIRLHLAFLPDQVRLAVTDDGNGFDVSQLQSSALGGFGLAGLKERAELMHGWLEIGRGTAGGTKVELSIPHA